MRLSLNTAGRLAVSHWAKMARRTTRRPEPDLRATIQLGP